MGQASQRVRADQLFQFDGQLFEVARHIGGFVHVAGVVLGEHVARFDIAGERMAGVALLVNRQRHLSGQRVGVGGDCADAGQALGGGAGWRWSSGNEQSRVG